MISKVPNRVSNKVLCSMDTFLTEWTKMTKSNMRIVVKFRWQILQTQKFPHGSLEKGGKGPECPSVSVSKKTVLKTE